jgi:ABC-type transporter Mla subunit MlaD
MAMRAFGWSGLILAVVCLLGLPFLLHSIQKSGADKLGSLGELLRNASSDLANQRATLDQLDVLLEKTAGLAGEIDDSLAAVAPLLDDMAVFLGDQMPVTLASTEKSLRSASAGAAGIDSLLRLLSKIPFLGSIEYDPVQPLDASLIQAADGISPLREPLIGLKTDLNAFNTALGEIRPETRNTELALTDFRGDLDDLKQGIEAGEVSLAKLASIVEKIQDRLPLVTFGSGLCLGWALLWFALANGALILQGTKLIEHVARG